MDWIQKLIYLSGNCGLYNILFLYAIVPEIVKTYNVIDILDVFRNISNLQFNLKFCSLPDIKEIDGFLNINGTPVSTKYLERTPDGWVCTEKYMSSFLNTINVFYAKPRKMSVVICGSDICTGMEE